MKYTFKIIILFLMFQSQAQEVREKSTTTVSSSDTLVLRTQKQKGAGMFELGAGSLNFKNIDSFNDSFIVPKGLKSITFSKIIPDFKEKETNYLHIIKGVLNSKEVFIIDQNGNYDFSDDAVYPINEFSWKSSDDLVQVHYDISNGEKSVKDSTWIDIGYSFGKLFFGRREHLTATIAFDEKQFTLGIISRQNTASFTYNYMPEIAMLSKGDIKTDSIKESALIKIGDYIKLNRSYYRFKNMSNNGEFLTLVKETDFKSKVGTQIGMLAPSFEAISVSGDSINSSDFKNKPLVIINSCGCGGDVESTEAYFEIMEFYEDKVDIIRLDSAIKKDDKGIHIDVEETHNKSIYDAFRGQYCSRICYVIDKNNRIIDKFQVTDWEKFLSKP